MPKQTASERFNSTLENIRYDLKLKSFADRHNESNMKNIKDSFQTTKLDILISNSNINSEMISPDMNKQEIQKSNREKLAYINKSKETSHAINSDSQLQKKIKSNKISDNTKKLLTKCYEIDLVSIASLKNNNNTGKKILTNNSNTKLGNNNNNNSINTNNSTVNTLMPRSSSFSTNLGSSRSTSTATMESNARRNFNMIENIKRQGG